MNEIDIPSLSSLPVNTSREWFAVEYSVKQTAGLVSYTLENPTSINVSADSIDISIDISIEEIFTLLFATRGSSSAVLSDQKLYALRNAFAYSHWLRDVSTFRELNDAIKDRRYPINLKGVSGRTLIEFYIALRKIAVNFQPILEFIRLVESDFLEGIMGQKLHNEFISLLSYHGLSPLNGSPGSQSVANISLGVTKEMSLDDFFSHIPDKRAISRIKGVLTRNNVQAVGDLINYLDNDHEGLGVNGLMTLYFLLRDFQDMPSEILDKMKAYILNNLRGSERDVFLKRTLKNPNLD